jgi:electron transfer flavoprotein alpha subunit
LKERWPGRGRESGKRGFINLADGRKVLVVAEPDRDGGASRLSLELAGLGVALARGLETGAVGFIAGNGIGAGAGELAATGLERVLKADDSSLAGYNPDVATRLLEEALGDISPRVILLGHTPAGQDLGPRLGFALGAGVVTDCVGVELHGSCIRFLKPVYGGNAVASMETTTKTAVATVRARVGKPSGGGAPCEITDIRVTPVEPRLSIGETVEEERGVSLEDAGVVVSGGRGIGGEEGFEELRELASLLGGALGASRPPCDSGWIPSTAQVGITGKIVAPDLYIAVALSGSTQHLTGMSDSGKVVSINSDPDAYIFKVSDYGVAGDWKRVIPAFKRRLGEITGEGRGS